MSDVSTITHVVTYGIGGYNPDMPNNNVVEEYWVDENGERVDPPVVTRHAKGASKETK